VPITDEINEIRGILESVEGLSSDRVDAAIRLRREIEGGQTRFWMTLILLGTYSFAVVAIVLFLIFRATIVANESAGNLIEVIKIGIMPVVIFVLGFYYGTSSR
jgi:hypothetical protein